MTQAANSPSSAPDPIDPALLRGLTVGVVEDSDEDWAVFSRVFRRYVSDAKVERWTRAEAVLELLDEGAITGDQRPDVLVVDLSLPGLDGCELVRRLRDHPATKDVPMFMLSGSIRQGDIDRCYAAGANAYFRKSSDSADLSALLDTILHAATPGTEAASLRRPPLLCVPAQGPSTGPGEPSGHRRRAMTLGAPSVGLKPRWLDGCDVPPYVCAPERCRSGPRGVATRLHRSPEPGLLGDVRSAWVDDLTHRLAGAAVSLEGERGCKRRPSRTGPSFPSFESTLSTVYALPQSVAPDDPATPTSALAALRGATRERHARLESRVDAVSAFAALDTYTDFLARLHGFHAPLQPTLDQQVEAHAPALAPMPPRAELLAVDLGRLGLDPADLPQCEALPTPAGPAELVGTLYVIEGSALGGAVLARLAHRTLGLERDTGTAFLSGDADLSSRWKLVVTTVEATAAEHGIDGIIAGATDTFDRMEAWLCR